MTKHKTRLFLASAVLAACACGPASTSDALAGAGADAAAATAPAPALWRLADDDSEIFLFGTFHILPPDVDWRTPAFEAAMKATVTTVTEADVSSAEAQMAIAGLVGRLGLNPEGTTLSSTLGKARARRLAKTAAQFGLSMQALEPYRPWLALITLSTVAMQRLGYDASSGVETVVLAQAAAERDKVDHLETATFQIEALASLDETEMLANFDASMDQFDEIAVVTQRMLDAWRTGDVDTLETEFLGELSADAPGAYATLIVARNANWTDAIDTMMKGEGSIFIAVGAGHLVGDDSVVSMLSARGYAVERVQ